MEKKKQEEDHKLHMFTFSFNTVEKLRRKSEMQSLSCRNRLVDLHCKPVDFVQIVSIPYLHSIKWPRNGNNSITCSFEAVTAIVIFKVIVSVNNILRFLWNSYLVKSTFWVNHIWCYHSHVLFKNCSNVWIVKYVFCEWYRCMILYKLFVCWYTCC